MFEIIYCDVIFLYVKWFYCDCPRSQTAAFYVLYIICSIWQSDSSLSRYTVVYLLPGNVFYCYILKIVIIFFNNLADIKVLRELNKGIFGNCGNVSLANV